MNLTNPKRNRSFIIDLAGNSWSWNCGWCIVGQDGHDTPMTKLGHQQFNRNIPRATREDINARIGSRSRPTGLWRRVIDVPYEHKHTGRFGTIVATDGVHAIFKTRDENGEFFKMEVMFNNLNECKPSQKLPKDKPTTSPKTKRAKQPTKSLASIGIDLNDLLS